MSTLIRRLGLGAMGMVALLAACTEAAGPEVHQARLVVQPSFAPMPAGSQAQNAASLVDNVRILIRHINGRLLFDEVFDWPVDQDELRVVVTLDVNGTESFEVEIQGRIGTQIMFRSETIRLQLTDGAAQAVVVAPVLEYSGPGSTVTALDIRGAPDSFVAGDSVVLTALGILPDGSQISDPPMEWTSGDPEAATVTPDGVVHVRHDVARTVAITGRLLHSDITASVGGPIRPAAVGITSDSPTLTAVGAEADLTAMVSGADGGAVANAPVTWESRQPGVVTVEGGEDSGLEATVHAVSGGSAWILARSGSAADSVLVAVRQSVAGIAVDPASASFDAIGQTAQASAAAFDPNGHPVADPDIDWSSRDGGVASVDASGVITSAGTGSTWIIAASGDAADSLHVTVEQTVTDIEVTPAEETMRVGGAITFEAMAVDRNGHPVPGLDATWSSSDGGVATVQRTGPTTALVTAVGSGLALISASSDGMTGTAVVDVLQDEVIHGSSVLYFTDFAVGTDRILAGLEELAEEGIIDLVVAELGDRDDLLARMEQNPDIVVYFNQDTWLRPADEAALVEWVESGKRLIFSDWTRNEQVFSALETVPGELTNESALTFLDPRMAEGVQQPMPLTNPGWGIYSTGMMPTGGAVSVCTFPSGESCLIYGNQGRTVTVGFLNDTVTGTDGRNFARNLLTIVVQGTLFHASASVGPDPAPSMRHQPPLDRGRDGRLPATNSRPGPDPAGRR